MWCVRFSIRYFLALACVFGCALSIFALSSPLLFAETSGEAQVAARKAELEAQLAELEKLIVAQQELVQKKSGERVSLERDVAILDAQIKKARLAIRARELEIERLEGDINKKTHVIVSLSEKIAREKDSLGELVRRTAELDDISLVEVVLSNQSISAFFEEMDDFEAVKDALHDSFREIEGTKNATEEAKSVLEERQEAAERLHNAQLLEKKKVEERQNERKTVLTTTKGEETLYKQYLANTERTAAEIRAALFELRGSAAIPFGEALEYANVASKKTGVRAAFILGILKQETRLGELKGDGSWRVDMHPTRDRPVFLTIMQNLGLDPDKMPVSAGGATYWGGAMGPSQFIPSTWACYGGYLNINTNTCGQSGGYTRDQFWAGPFRYDAAADRIRTYMGKNSPSNPYAKQDAFMATALYMKDLGADAGGFTVERTAALRYYAGGNWSLPANAFYGDSVMEHATYFQKQIDTLARLE